MIELWICQCGDEEQRIREQHHTERQCQTAAMKAGSSPHRLFEAFSAIIAKRRNAEARVGRLGSLRRYPSIIARRLS